MYFMFYTYLLKYRTLLKRRQHINILMAFMKIILQFQIVALHLPNEKSKSMKITVSQKFTS